MVLLETGLSAQITQTTKLVSGETQPVAWFGHAVAIAGDTAIIGAMLDSANGHSSGAAFVFTRAHGVWTPQQKLTAGDAAAFQRFGAAVAISGDTVVIGANTDSSVAHEHGSAYVFTRSGGVWTQQQKLTADDAAAHFGNSVAVEGDTALIGTPNNGGPGLPGAAYVFTRSGSTWSAPNKLTPSDSSGGDGFGYAVDLRADAALVGAPGSGGAYVFARATGTWTQQQKLVPADAGAQNAIGTAVAIDNALIVLSTAGPVNPNFSSGSAYVFTLSAGTWMEQQKLTAPDVVGDYFGESVDISGDTIVIGAPFDDDRGNNAGAAYVFSRSGTVWRQRKKLTASDASTCCQEFGFAAAMNGNTLLVGSYKDDHSAPDAGAAYVFTVPPLPGKPGGLRLVPGPGER